MAWLGATIIDWYDSDEFATLKEADDVLWYDQDGFIYQARFTNGCLIDEHGQPVTGVVGWTLVNDIDTPEEKNG